MRLLIWTKFDPICQRQEAHLIVFHGLFLSVAYLSDSFFSIKDFAVVGANFSCRFKNGQKFVLNFIFSIIKLNN